MIVGVADEVSASLRSRGDTIVDIRIHSKDCPGETAFWLMNYSEVIARIREEAGRAVCARAKAEGREPTAGELEEVEAAARSVPTEISIPEEAFRGEGAVDVGERILSSFFPVHRPAGARIVQPLGTGVDLSPLIKVAVRSRRASGVDDASIRTQILNEMASSLDRFGTYTRDRKMQALVRAIDEALAEPTATRPKSSDMMVKVARRTVTAIVKAGRKEGMTDADLREYLATHLAGIHRQMMEDIAASGLSPSIVEESLRAHQQVIAEILGPENPPIPEQMDEEQR
jgi:hypothetical protein